MKNNFFRSNLEAFENSKEYIPGGVSSPVRSFYQVGGIPIFVSKAKGSKIHDIEGKTYIDYIMSWGALILGHSYRKVINTVKKYIHRGTSYGLPTEVEYALAKTISELIPSVDMVRFVSSGTEACMSAVRLARGFTGKSKIIKFEGCYHGHADYFLVSAGSGVANIPTSTSKGVPSSLIQDSIILPFNDEDAFLKTIDKEKDIACVIIEPIPANMGVVIPKDGFLKLIRDVCSNRGIILIFDEVITGFRFGVCGVQELLGIKPDLTCLGKIVGGGFPLACFGGRRDIMSLLAPLGDVYQAGTLSGNPIAVIAGLTTLSILKTMDYSYLEKIANMLVQAVKDISRSINTGKIKLVVNQFKSLFSIFFSEKDHIRNFTDVKSSSKELYSKLFHNLLKRGILIPPSLFEGWFVSFAHTQKDIELTISALHSAIKETFE
ncbi:MAG: glutamate-1-semialdehyde 2,1-aminomutase [Spirochaetes bacterium]|nr:glutamate-1-semialdehyde 2,1-aminomutase [Spirochaetota bacterium]